MRGFFTRYSRHMCVVLLVVAANSGAAQQTSTCMKSIARSISAAGSITPQETRANMTSQKSFKARLPKTDRATFNKLVKAVAHRAISRYLQHKLSAPVMF